MDTRSKRGLPNFNSRSPRSKRSLARMPRTTQAHTSTNGEGFCPISRPSRCPSARRKRLYLSARSPSSGSGTSTASGSAPRTLPRYGRRTTFGWHFCRTSVTTWRRTRSFSPMGLISPTRATYRLGPSAHHACSSGCTSSSRPRRGVVGSRMLFRWTDRRICTTKSSSRRHMRR